MTSLPISSVPSSGKPLVLTTEIVASPAPKGAARTAVGIHSSHVTVWPFVCAWGVVPSRPRPSGAIWISPEPGSRLS